MGIFNDLGRRAERFKQSVAEAAAGAYKCGDCGEQFHAERDACPECGGDVEPVA